MFFFIFTLTGGLAVPLPPLDGRPAEETLRVAAGVCRQPGAGEPGDRGGVQLHGALGG